MIKRNGLIKKTKVLIYDMQDFILKVKKFKFKEIHIKNEDYNEIMLKVKTPLGETILIKKNESEELNREMRKQGLAFRAWNKE